MLKPIKSVSKFILAASMVGAMAWAMPVTAAPVPAAAALRRRPCLSLSCEPKGYVNSLGGFSGGADGIRRRGLRLR